MITFAQIQDRIGCMRPDKLGREWQLAFQVSARRLAAETLGLQAIVEFEVLANSVYSPVYDSTVDEKEAVFIFKAEWQKVDLTWVPLVPLNQEKLNDLTGHTHDSPGEMKAFTSDQGKFRPNRPPAVNTQVRAVVAYKPIGDFDEVDFGPEFEDALVEGALSHLMRLPGELRNVQDFELAERRFLSMSSGLRGSVLVGDVGYARGSINPERLSLWGFMGQDRMRY
jgi:hypothetical protein